MSAKLITDIFFLEVEGQAWRSEGMTELQSRKPSGLCEGG